MGKHATSIRRSAAHLRLQLVDGVDKNIVGLLQPLELPKHHLEVRRVRAGPDPEEPRQGLRLERRQPGQIHHGARLHRRAYPAGPRVPVRHVHGARLREERGGRVTPCAHGWNASPHPPKPRSKQSETAATRTAPPSAAAPGVQVARMMRVTASVGCRPCSARRLPNWSIGCTWPWGSGTVGRSTWLPGSDDGILCGFADVV
jgi:hypothetical protein